MRKALRLWKKSSYIRERGRQTRREEQQTYFQKRTPRWAESPQKKVERLEQMRGKEHVSKESKLVWRRKASVAVVVGEGATDGKKPQKGSEECPQAKARSGRKRKLVWRRKVLPELKKPEDKKKVEEADEEEDRKMRDVEQEKKELEKEVKEEMTEGSDKKKELGKDEEKRKRGECDHEKTDHDRVQEKKDSQSEEEKESRLGGGKEKKEAKECIKDEKDSDRAEVEKELEKLKEPEKKAMSEEERKLEVEKKSNACRMIDNAGHAISREGNVSEVQETIASAADTNSRKTGPVNHDQDDDDDTLPSEEDVRYGNNLCENIAEYVQSHCKELKDASKWIKEAAGVHLSIWKEQGVSAKEVMRRIQSNHSHVMRVCYDALSHKNHVSAKQTANMMRIIEGEIIRRWKMPSRFVDWLKLLTYIMEDADDLSGP